MGSGGKVRPGLADEKPDQPHAATAIYENARRWDLVAERERSPSDHIPESEGLVVVVKIYKTGVEVSGTFHFPKGARQSCYPGTVAGPIEPVDRIVGVAI